MFNTNIKCILRTLIFIVSLGYSKIVKFYVMAYE